jgi:cytochrome c-type biogenesis protein CcmH
VIFTSLAILMAAIAAACIAIPLWRGRTTENISTAEAGQGVYRKQLAELERDLANGLLAENDYQSALRDLEDERRRNQPRTQAPSSRIPVHRRFIAIATPLVMVAIAGLLYWRMGNWRVGTEGVDAASQAAIQDMVQKLSDRLNTTDQNDLQGWLMLGHAYMLMERYQDAETALNHARKLAGDSNSDVLSAYAEALTMADPDHFAQRAAPLFENVLKLNPDDEKALWYGGLAASQRGDDKLAIKRWQRLLAQGLPEKYSTFVSQYIKQAGGTVTAVAAKHTATSIHLHVSLSPSLKSGFAADDMVFVFARPEGGQGGPPLAVRRFHVQDLPLDVTLSDRDAMIAGRSLSDFDAIELVARISKDGSPLPKSGEPSGIAEWKRGDDSKVIDIKIKPAVN